MTNVVNLTRTTDPATAPEHGGTAAIGRTFYTAAEVADILRIDLSSTYAALRAGELPGIKENGRWAISRNRLLTWLNDVDQVTEGQAAANRRASITDLTDEEKDLVWWHRNRDAIKATQAEIHEAIERSRAARRR